MCGAEIAFQRSWVGDRSIGMKRFAWIVSLGAALAFGGCGGGGSNQCTSRDASGAPPCSATTRTCYVSTSGNDANDGSAPDPAHAFHSIDHAIDVVQSSYAIIVSPGTYAGISTDREGRCAPTALSLIADSGRDAVIIDGRNAASGAGIHLSNGDDSIVDGFAIINSPGSGVLVKSQSDRVQVRNCIIRGNGSDGIHVQDSSNLLIFNNLVYGNNGIGIALVGDGGSPNGRVINNTVAFNAGRGVEIGRSNGASGGALTRNNIIQDNSTANVSGENIKVFDNSSSDYDGNFNLVSPPVYIRQTIAGPNDVKTSALFDGASASANPDGFRLRPNSPAIDRGATNLGSEFVALVQLLTTRSTTTAGNADQIPIDIGYHFSR